MRLCICDDQEREREGVKRVCEQFLAKQAGSFEISEASGAVEVLALVHQIDLLILDIEMPGMDGVELKNILQKQNSQCIIVFVTSHDNLMQEAFGVNVIGFVKKGEIEKKLVYYLEMALRMLHQDVLLDGRYHSREIVRIHSEREYCSLHFEDGTDVLLRGSLTGLERQLADADFVRINRAWMIHLKYVDYLGKREVRVAGETLMASRSAALKLHAAYEAYCARNARYY